MARQLSPFPFKGTINGISFYESQDGFMARKKGGVSADRIKTDPRFKITRLNGLEFGAAGKAGKLFRSAFLPEISKAADNRIIGRVAQSMVKVLQTDAIHGKGERTVSNGNLLLLEGFQFNKNIVLNTVLKEPFIVTVDRPTGQLTVAFPSFVPDAKVSAPTGTTHYRIMTAAAEIDFVTGATVINRQVTANLPWDDNPAAALSLQQQVTPNSTHPLFLVLGIEFMIITNGQIITQSVGLNALQLIKVSVV